MTTINLYHIIDYIGHSCMIFVIYLNFLFNLGFFFNKISFKYINCQRCMKNILLIYLS